MAIHHFWNELLLEDLLLIDDYLLGLHSVLFRPNSVPYSASIPLTYRTQNQKQSHRRVSGVSDDDWCNRSRQKRRQQYFLPGDRATIPFHSVFFRRKRLMLAGRSCRLARELWEKRKKRIVWNANRSATFMIRISQFVHEENYLLSGIMAEFWAFRRNSADSGGIIHYSGRILKIPTELTFILRNLSVGM